jgi:hypothetical protein
VCVCGGIVSFGCVSYTDPKTDHLPSYSLSNNVSNFGYNFGHIAADELPHISFHSDLTMTSIAYRSTIFSYSLLTASLSARQGLAGGRGAGGNSTEIQHLYR